MKTYYLNSMLAIAIVMALSSCRSDSLHTSDTALATISNFNSNRVYYINDSANKLSDDLVLHLEIIPNKIKSNIPTVYSDDVPATYGQASDDDTPSRIGPFTVNKSRKVKKHSWDLERIILEWIFECEEAIALAE